ncbi:MAG: PAS domain S-box protein, partial [Thermodesulfobacteriota bacterium]|nr:PAS domain S-box protein [Thermodesulfobacteriota bacterium]
MPEKSTSPRTARKKPSPAKTKKNRQRDCVLDCVDILKNLQSGVAILDPDCTILQVNPAFCKITGYSEDELLGRNFKKLIVPATGADARGFIDAIGDGACRDFKTDWEILRKDKTSLWVRLKLSFTRPVPEVPYQAVITVEDITAKRAAQHLSKNRLYFQQTLMETIPNPVFYKDMNGIFLGCNKAYEKFIGLSRDRIIGKTINDIKEIKFAEICRKMDGKMSKSPGEQTFESSVRMTDGTRREIIFNRAPFFNTDLSLGGLVGIMIDITELRQTEKELKKIQAELEKRVEKRTAKLKASNIRLKEEIKERKRIQDKMKARDELLHGILRSVVSQIGVLDVEGNIIAVNEVWQSFGLEEGAPEIKAPGVGENYLDICASGEGGFAGFSKEASAGIKSVLDNESEQFTLEYPCHLTDRERWFLMFVTPLKGDWGGAVVCHIDITERKAAEIAMSAAEEKYRSIFENAVEGIFQVTPRGRFLSLNPAMAKIFGYESPEEMKRSVKDVQSIYVDPRRREEFLRRLHTYGELVNFESQAYRKDGTTIWVTENARTVLDEKGKIAFYEGSMEDITLRKRAEEQLLRQAFYDNVTNLPNKALFMDRLGQSIERAKRNEDYRYAVLFLDLDRFKIINDSLGHSLGDHLLTIIANKLKILLRGLDTVARFGGDEFAILLE